MPRFIHTPASSAPPSGGVFYTDDFTTDPASRWTAITGTAWTWNSGSSNVTSTLNSHWGYNSPANTITQLVYAKFSDSFFNNFAGVGLRSDGTGTTNAYVLRVISSTAFLVRSVQGATGVNDIKTITHTPVDGNYYGLRVEGTGNDTVFHFFDFGASNPGLDETTTLAQAKAASVSWQIIDNGNWTDNDEPADGGKEGFFYDGGQQVRNFGDFNYGDTSA